MAGRFYDGQEDYIAQLNALDEALDPYSPVVLVNTVWTSIPTLFRLALTGTGSITLDSMDLAGTITSNVFSVTKSAAVNQIEYPYAGDSAVKIRATFTGSLSAKII